MVAIAPLALLATPLAGAEPRLSPSMHDALGELVQRQIERCYSLPPGASKNGRAVLEIDVRPDGSLAAEPRIASSNDNSVAQAALRAVRRCAPYTIPAKYDPYYNDWKMIRARFNNDSSL